MATVVAESRGQSPLSRDVALARRLEEAERLYAAGRWAEAEARYAAVLDAVPGDPRIRLKRALALFRSNPADSSAYGFVEEELSSDAVAKGPEVLESLALVAVERQDWAEALGRFDRLFELRPDATASLRAAGECALRAGDADRALSYFERASAADPSDPEASGGLARARGEKAVE
jgi:Flp pilus assembly protein TadD